MFEKVLVGVGGDKAGGDAIALAKGLVSPQGELTLLHVYVVTSKPAPDSGAVGEAAKRRYERQRLAALAGEFEIDARAAWVEARSVRRGLHQYASGEHADLLVVGATGYDELARDYVDDTHKVLEDAPCTVAVAPTGYSELGGAITRIGVAYDGSPESERALALARTLAAQRHAVLSAFEAVQAPIHVGDPANQEAELEERVEEARGRIAALGGVDASAELGDAVDELVHYAESIDLLVLGSHRYRPIDRFLLQSTAQQLADVASSPLLVLPRA
ncbi:MAG: universal stress protein [Solirubrobacterales bacterium]|nr:universal stress protein [Solirubrobacterales bacterium]MBV9166583.1 universal stress protein [Solirubrobacterales bacterium]MBV9533834.1 universal stress protein [Solirubrobacterales bacterium]